MAKSLVHRSKADPRMRQAELKVINEALHSFSGRPCIYSILLTYLSCKPSMYPKRACQFSWSPKSSKPCSLDFNSLWDPTSLYFFHFAFHPFIYILLLACPVLASLSILHLLPLMGLLTWHELRRPFSQFTVSHLSKPLMSMLKCRFHP